MRVCGKVNSNCRASDEGGGGVGRVIRPEKDSVRPRGVVAELAQFSDGERIKSWVQVSKGERLGSYSGGGISSTPPPLYPSSQFPKEEEEEGKRGKWEEVIAVIKFGVQVITEMGRQRPCRMHGLWGGGNRQILDVEYMYTGTVAKCPPCRPNVTVTMSP